MSETRGGLENGPPDQGAELDPCARAHALMDDYNALEHDRLQELTSHLFACRACDREWERRIVASVRASATSTT
jgi:hypothetical protein